MKTHPSLEIAKVGHPILQQTAQTITDFANPTLQDLIQSLMTTMMKYHGVGIAAPQVFQSLRLFIIASHPNPRYPEAPMMNPIVMMNPRILSHSSEITQEKDWEGCLSVQGVRGLVPRYQTITVEYCDHYGQLKYQELTDFVARIFQHELDHLNGLVFLDRLESSQDLQDITESI